MSPKSVISLHDARKKEGTTSPKELTQNRLLTLFQSVH